MELTIDMYNIIIIFVLFSSFLESIFCFNITGIDESCRILYTSGYGYNSFFHIPESSLMEDGSIYLTFSVKAASNAHILLSPNSYALDRDIVYEIVLGAGKNTFTTIRKLRTSLRTSANTVGLLKEDEALDFWITVNNGVIEVGKSGKPDPLVNFEDTNPLEVKYLAFGSWVGATACWIYDCKNITKTENQLDHLKGVAKIKKTLLDEHDPSIPPISNGDEAIFIFTAFAINYVDLDLQKSVLTTHIKFNFTWSDPYLVWEPSEFDNINSIKVLHRQLWRPYFFIFNSLTKVTFKSNRDQMTLFYDGKVQWTPEIRMITNCNNSDITHWPWDTHFCTIHLGFQQYAAPISFILRNFNIPKLAMQIVGNEWEMFEVGTMVQDAQENEFTTQNNNSVLIISIKLKRQSSPFVHIFLLPIIFVTIASQFSYLLPIYSQFRICINITSSVIFSLYLLVLSSIVPSYSDTNSFLVTFTSRMFTLIALQTIISAFLMNLAKLSDESPPSLSIKRLVGNKNIRTIFVLPEENFQGNSYSELQENPYNSLGKLQNVWILFSIILDRIVFIISTIIIIIPLIITI